MVETEGSGVPRSLRLQYVSTTRGCASGTTRMGVNETTGERVRSLKHLAPEAPRHQHVSQVPLLGFESLSLRHISLRSYGGASRPRWSSGLRLHLGPKTESLSLRQPTSIGPYFMGPSSRLVVLSLILSHVNVGLEAGIVTTGGWASAATTTNADHGLRQLRLAAGGHRRGQPPLG